MGGRNIDLLTVMSASKYYENLTDGVAHRHYNHFII